MSPKRQQVLIVPKRVSCPKCPKKASCPKCPNCPPAKGKRRRGVRVPPPLARRVPHRHPRAHHRPALEGFFNWIELNIVPGQCWCCFQYHNPLCHQMNLKTSKYSPPHPIILSSPSSHPHAIAKYTNMQLSHLPLPPLLLNHRNFPNTQIY